MMDSCNRWWRCSRCASTTSTERTFTAQSQSPTDRVLNPSTTDQEIITNPSALAKPFLLTGPARSILAYDSITIDMALKDKDKLSPDNDISSKQIWWNVYHTTTNKYDEPSYDDFPGKNGSVTVNYIVFSHAFEATVEVTFVNRDEHVDVRPEQPILLSRSMVAVPSNSSLIVRADLMDHDGEIAKGTAEFPAQLSGTSQKNIFGQHGEIRVSMSICFLRP
ncbi:hypothetical protein LOK49_LG12G03032 [Camellia lanceoleosa]|uniref:Uncharacterized protein n=1 Tax=Camellia lanceoleosa TaxID=1840588 RepID=A0ACC0FXJ6_9ERIC|nr:hypothetical protein LOK49_LG12G03032 [Camellia lanceoleosa]